MEVINSDDGSAVDIIRDRARMLTDDDRKRNRNREFNKLRRTALGGQANEESAHRDEWKGDTLVQKGKQLKKKSLSIEDYRHLELSLLQSEENIKNFMSIDQILSALVRDLSSSHPEIQLLALHCCCNIALSNEKHCTILWKFIGPYLMTQLESRSNPLLEASAWTIGNLCNSGSESVHVALHSLGCFKRFYSLLQSCQTTIVPAIAYALKFYLFGNYSSQVVRESDLNQVTLIILQRLSTGADLSLEVLWLLALLSSTATCRSTLSNVQFITKIFLHLIDSVNESEKSSECDASKVIPVVRLLANLSSDESAVVADLILVNNERTVEILNGLLRHSHTSVKRETLWLIGNLYNHPSLHVREAVRNCMECLDFTSAVKA